MTPSEGDAPKRNAPRRPTTRTAGKEAAEKWIREFAENAPPFTEEQGEQLRALFDLRTQDPDYFRP